jgi:hypothetical protein
MVTYTDRVMAQSHAQLIYCRKHSSERHMDGKRYKHCVVRQYIVQHSLYY